MAKVFVPTGIIEYVERDIDNVQSSKTTDLFLDNENISFVARNIHTLRRKYGVAHSFAQTRTEVTLKMKQWVNNYDFADSSIGGNQLETLDYYNKQFTRSMDPGHRPYVPRIGDLEPDENPFRAKPFGKRVKDFYVEDMRNADLWDPVTIVQDDYSTRRTRGNKGINNPHIRGAHRRNYDWDNTEALRSHEKGSDRTWGYDMSDIYATTGGDY